MDVKNTSAPTTAAVVAAPDLTSRPHRCAVDRDMKAAPSALYKVWTRQFGEWFAAPGTLLTPGTVNTPFFFEVRENEVRHPHYGRYLRVERNKVIEITWVNAAVRGAGTVVTVEIGPRHRRTNLRVRHAGFQRTNRACSTMSRRGRASSKISTTG